MSLLGKIFDLYHEAVLCVCVCVCVVCVCGVWCVCVVCVYVCVCVWCVCVCGVCVCVCVVCVCVLRTSGETYWLIDRPKEETCSDGSIALSPELKHGRCANFSSDIILVNCNTR